MFTFSQAPYNVQYKVRRKRQSKNYKKRHFIEVAFFIGNYVSANLSGEARANQALA